MGSALRHLLCYIQGWDAVPMNTNKTLYSDGFFFAVRGLACSNCGRKIL